MNKYTSRKYQLTLLITLLATALPIVFRYCGVSDAVALVALSIILGIGVSYQVVNLKGASIGKKEDG